MSRPRLLTTVQNPQVVVVVVLTGDFTNVFIHARKWVHLIMGAMSLWT